MYSWPRACVPLILSQKPDFIYTYLMDGCQPPNTTSAAAATSSLTFTSLTGESVIVVPRCFVSTHDTQFFPFDPSCLWHVPGPFAHRRRRRRHVLHLSVIADLQGRLPQFIYPSVCVPFVPSVWRVVVVAGVVRCGGHSWFHGCVLHTGIVGKG